MTKKEKLLLFVLACVNFTHIVDFMILMPLGPNLMRVFEINAQQFGYVVSAYGLAAGVSGFLLAFFADKYDRKKVLLLAYIGFVIGTFACAIAPSYAILMAARIVTGIFGGMIGSQVLSIVSDVFTYERRAAAMGIISAAFSLASVVGVPGGLFLANMMGWHAPFYTVGALGVVVTPLVYFFVPNINKHLFDKKKESKLAALTQIFASKNQQRALLFSTLVMLGHFSIIPYISPSLVSNANYSENDIYLIYLVGGLLTIFSAPMVGKLADKKGKYPVFLTFALLSFLPIILITHLSPQPMYYILIVSGLFFVFSNGRFIPSQAMVSAVVSPQQRGSFLAINSSVRLLAQAVATNIGGAIILQQESGYLERYNYVGYFAVFMIVIAMWVAAKIKVEE